MKEINNKIFNRKIQKPTRQTLRSNQTTPEKILWNRIRNEQLGVKFRRQHGIDRYIADFYCSEKSLVIELDGNNHLEKDALEYDEIRDEFMRSLGIKILRFGNSDVICDVDGVVEKILKIISL